MRTINLLPWREELRQTQKKEYLVALGVSVLAGALVWLSIHSYYGMIIDHQNSRNNLLNRHIAELDKKIVEIKQLEKEREKLIARMTAVEELQTSRHLAVRLFDEVSRTLPDGVYLTELEQNNDTATIKGVAQSNARVSNFMRNLESSEWLEQPRLNIIETTIEKGKRTSEFTLQVQQKKKKSGESE